MYQDSKKTDVSQGRKVEEIHIKTLEEYISEVYNIMSNQEPKTYGFRGHKMSTYVLKPGAGRDSERLTEEQEKTAFLEFKRNYKRFYPIELENDVDILMLAQHYGLKTRLLDWSYNPLIALYMATEKLTDKDKKECSNQLEASTDGVVYIKKIGSLVSLKKGNKESPFQFTKNTLLVPENFEIRFVNQEGFFEIFPNPSEESNDGICNKIIIKEKFKAEIHRKLEIFGINKLHVYPTLDNLCEQINKLINKIKTCDNTQKNEK